MTTVLACFNAQPIMGLYAFSKAIIILSPKFFLFVLGGFRKVADTIGIYVKESNITPKIANPKVIAIG